MLKRNSVVCFLVMLVAGLGSAVSYAEEDVRLQLKWAHSWQFAGYYAAQKKGFYADAGLNVAIIERSLQHNHIDTVLAGNAEYGVADSSIVLHRLNGRPIVALAAVFQHSPLVLMTLAKDGLIGPHELKGKRVMYQRGVDDAVITAMFTLLGIPDDYFQYLEHRLDDDALLRGETDAISAYLTNQPLMYERRGYQVNIINPANYGIDFYGDTLFTSEAELKEHPDRVKRFIAASLKGWSYALEHRSEVSQWLREDFGIKRSKELLMAEAEAIERMIIPKLVEIGYLNPVRYERIAEIYKELGMAKPKAKITGIYIDDYSQKPYSFEQWIKWAVASCLFLLLMLIVVLGINRRLNHLVKARTQELYQIANTDHLTGINNRKKLESLLSLDSNSKCNIQCWLRPCA
ncbi:ABC transporter substrate-binding protein, partial [Candidatus Nitrotoga sp. BS]|uniref:ABC transporter substrate-binding protein n=1 Tax=Candidatus Nitrotoga sp. BS TaxID=2890408 RepID=UPI001EF34B53